jgi:Lrp/AsnC family transcriptional regulator
MSVRYLSNVARTQERRSLANGQSPAAGPIRQINDDVLLARLGDAQSLDKIDLRILRIVQANPEISVMKLADEIGLSHTPCWRRLKRLEKDGIILGPAKLLNADWLGFRINVFASVRLQVHDESTMDQFENAVASCREIVECFSVSGDSDYMLRVVCRTIEEYEQLLKKVLLHLPGVAAVNSRITLKRVKLTTMLPL